MASAVLDASALLALFQSEPGSDQVLGHLNGGVMSSVNVSEVAGKLIDGGLPPAIVRSALDGLHLDVRSFEVGDAHGAAVLQAAGKGQTLSLGDRACLALARRLGVAAVTADKAWAQLDVGVQVAVIR